MLDFCKRNISKEIYVYGINYRGKIIYQYLKRNGIYVTGFVISDGQPIPEDVDAPIFYLSSLDGENSAILLGINYYWFNDIFPTILKKGISDVYFVNGMKDYITLQRNDSWFKNKHENEEEMYHKIEYSYEMSRKIFSYFREKGLKFESAIDFGGGTGAWAKAVKDVMECEILVLDGSMIDRSSLLTDGEFMACDLADPKLLEKLGINKKADIAITIEVAEHLEEESADSFIGNLCKASDIVLFSAAISYQGGQGHVNEQMQTYWRKKFEERDYYPIDCIRLHFWNDDSINNYIKQNCFVYANKSKYDEIINKLGNDKLPMDIVHPTVWNLRVGRLIEGWN